MSAAVRAASVAADGRLAAQRQKYWSGCKGGAVLQAGGGGRGGDESRGLVPERRRGCKACSRADEHRAEQPPRHRRRKTRWFCHNLRMGWRARGWRSEGARPEGLTGMRPLAQQLPVGFSGLSGPDSSPLYIGTGRPASGAASQAASCLSSFATGIRSVHGNGNGSQNVVFFSPRVYGRGAVERQPRSPPWLMFERHHAKRWRNVVAGVRASRGRRAVGAPTERRTRTEECELAVECENLVLVTQPCSCVNSGGCL